MSLSGIESKIVNRLLDAIFYNEKPRYQVTIHDGENETALLHARTAVRREMAATERDTVHLWTRDDKGNMQRAGHVVLIYGNGLDLISDYSLILEDLLKPVTDWTFNDLALTVKN